MEQMFTTLEAAEDLLKVRNLLMEMMMILLIMEELKVVVEKVLLTQIVMMDLLMQLQTLVVAEAEGHFLNTLQVVVMAELEVQAL